MIANILRKVAGARSAARHHGIARAPLAAPAK